MTEVQLSQTGQLAFIGINDFVKISTRDENTGNFNFKNLPSSAINYTVFKEVGGTHILYSDKETNRFEFFDFNMQEIARIASNGVQQICPKFNRTKSFHSNLHDPHVFLWPCGNTSLGIIDLSKNEYSKVDGLGGSMNNLSHTAVSCDMGRRVMTCCYDAKTRQSIFSFWTKTSAKDTDNVVKSVDSRELRMDKNGTGCELVNVL